MGAQGAHSCDGEFGRERVLWAAQSSILVGFRKPPSEPGQKKGCVHCALGGVATISPLARIRARWACLGGVEDILMVHWT